MCKFNIMLYNLFSYIHNIVTFFIKVKTISRHLKYRNTDKKSILACIWSILLNVNWIGRKSIRSNTVLYTSYHYTYITISLLLRKYLLILSIENFYVLSIVYFYLLHFYISISRILHFICYPVLSIFQFISHITLNFMLIILNIRLSASTALL